MAHFYRDQQIKNSTIDEDSLKQIVAVLENRKAALNARVPPERVETESGFLTYIIRFDNKGYRVSSLSDLLRYFHQAKEVERIFFNIDTGDSIRFSRQVGAFLELGLDARDPSRCFLSVTSDDGDWVDASISTIQDVIAKCKNKNGWVRTAWMLLAVQIVGVALGFVFCLWIAGMISPKLAIENSFVITFLFLLLMFSNVWMFLNQKILFFVNGLFPNIDFSRPRKNRLHWLMQRIVGTIIIAMALFAISKLASFLGDILSSFMRKGS